MYFTNNGKLSGRLIVIKSNIAPAHDSNKLERIDMIGEFDNTRKFWTCLKRGAEDETTSEEQNTEDTCRQAGETTFHGKYTSQHLHNLLQEKDTKLLIATDGTNKDRKGVFVIIIYTEVKNSQEVILTGFGPVDGEIMDSTRAEIGRLLAAIILLYQITTKHQSDIRCKIIITLDNQQAARLSQRWLTAHQIYDPTKKYQDLLSEIKRLYKRLGRPPIEVQWDKGHLELTKKV